MLDKSGFATPTNRPYPPLPFQSALSLATRSSLPDDSFPSPIDTDFDGHAIFGDEATELGFDEREFIVDFGHQIPFHNDEMRHR